MVFGFWGLMNPVDEPIITSAGVDNQNKLGLPWTRQ